MSLVLYDQRGSVGHIRLNRPAKLNAINSEMLDAIADRLTQVENDPSVHALVLSGEGRAFSAGFDLDMGRPEAGESKREFLSRELRRDFELIIRVWRCPKPVICAVHGFCLGRSMEISAVCDVTLAAAGCRFGAPEVKFGSGIVCLILPWIIGQKNARELLLVGSDKIDAERAEAIGLVNRVVDEDELLDRAFSLAGQIASNDPLAVQFTKKAMNQSLTIVGLEQALENALEIDIDIETTETPASIEFDRRLKAEGSKAALAWRARQTGQN